MPIARQTPDASKFNRDANLPYMLRLEDFGLVMQDREVEITPLPSDNPARQK